jgi:hypothetical protein
MLTICMAVTSAAGTATVRNGYVACEDLSTLVLALKYIKEKKDVTTSDRQFSHCFRTESISGLRVEIMDTRDGYLHLLLRAEKPGERNLEFWTQGEALNQSKPKESKTKSSK